MGSIWRTFAAFRANMDWEILTHTLSRWLTWSSMWYSSKKLPSVLVFPSWQSFSLYSSSLGLPPSRSSVIHGGISTFLAISVLSAAKSYIFEVFFKLWFGIIIF